MTTATDLTSPGWVFDDVTVHTVTETELAPGTGAWLFPDLDPATVAGHDWMVPDHANPDHTLRLDSHSFAVRADGLLILVDTGVGNAKTRANPAWHDLRTDYLARLAAIGFAPEDVDLVVLTHLHTDHVGWNTRLDNNCPGHADAHPARAAEGRHDLHPGVLPAVPERAGRPDRQPRLSRCRRRDVSARRLTWRRLWAGSLFRHCQGGDGKGKHRAQTSPGAVMTAGGRPRSP